jgi:hypothetical protein
MDINTFLTGVTAVTKAIDSLAKEDSVRGFLNGTYSDGSVRSWQDAKNGEYLSPKQKAKAAKRKKKKKKNKFRL